MTPNAGAWKGVVVGLLNVVVIAMALAIGEHQPGVVPLVLVFGAVPGIVLGLVLGVAAGAFSKLPTLVRLAMLVGPAIGLVYLLADEFAMRDYTWLAMIPTAVAASILERWTRWREKPPLPLARVA